MGVSALRWICGAGFALLTVGCGGDDSGEATNDTSCSGVAGCEATDTGSTTPSTPTGVATDSPETTPTGADTAVATDTAGTSTSSREDTTGESTGGATGDTTAGTTGAEGCDQDGELDPTCVERDSATPICAPGGVCVACTAHVQCPGTACHLDALDPLSGSCFDPTEALWIDNQAACPGLGTELAPYCSLADTAALLGPGDVRVLRILGGQPYAERATFDGDLTVALIGVGDPVIEGNPAQQSATLSFDNGATAYAAGLHLDGNALSHGMLCNSSSVRLENSSIIGNAGWGGFGFEPCTLDLRRAVLVGNEDGGLRLAGGALALTNSTVGLNGVGGNSSGLRIEDGQVDILYSTVAGNNGAGADSLECSNAVGSIRNSIVQGADVLSIELDCFPLVMENNGLDSANFASGSNIEVSPYAAATFVDPAAGDFRLAAPRLSPFGDVAQWVAGDPELDADGTPRPMGGASGYAGIDEP